MRFVALLSLLVLLAAPVLAQAQEEDHHQDPNIDPTTSPLVLPTLDDFAPEPGTGDAVDKAGTVGLSTYVEVTSDQKSGLLTPFYRLTRRIALKARVPLIFDRTFHFFSEDLSTSGLGDVTVDAEYEKPLGTPGSVFRAQLSVKLPTGDDEKLTEDSSGLIEYNTPLGTGTTDILARATYARSTSEFGWIGGLLFRKNGGLDTVYDLGAGVTQTMTVTSGDQLVGSVFARKRQGGKLWLHFGAVVTMIGESTTKFEYSDATPSSESNGPGGMLLDVHPGVSFQLGKLNPYLGVRLPVSTSYDDDAFGNPVEIDRDLAVIFQFTYRPGRMAE